MTRTGAIYRHQRERAAKAGTSLDYTLEDLRNLCRAFADCPYCLASLTPRTTSLDHIQPISRLGTHTLANLVPCCAKCNRAKGNLAAEEYRQLLALLGTWESRPMIDTLARLRRGHISRG